MLLDGLHLPCPIAYDVDELQNLGQQASFFLGGFMLCADPRSLASDEVFGAANCAPAVAGENLSKDALVVHGDPVVPLFYIYNRVRH